MHTFHRETKLISICNFILHIKAFIYFYFYFFGFFVITKGYFFLFLTFYCIFFYFTPFNFSKSYEYQINFQCCDHKRFVGLGFILTDVVVVC